MQSVDFFYAIWQIIQIFSRNQNKIIICFSNSLGKLLCFYECIFFIYKYNIS